MTGRKNKPIFGWTALRFSGLAALCGVVCSCSPIPNYPAQFPALALSAEETAVRHPPLDRPLVPQPLKCPNIAGRYSDKGRALSPNGKELGQISLTQILHWNDPRIAATATNADTVVVIGPEEDVIEIQSWQGAVQVSTWRQHRLPQEEPGGRVVGATFICERGFVRLARSYHGDWSGLGSDFLWVRRAVDGSLIAYHHVGGAGENAWYRFLPVSGGS